MWRAYRALPLCRPPTALSRGPCQAASFILLAVLGRGGTEALHTCIAACGILVTACGL